MAAAMLRVRDGEIKEYQDFAHELEEEVGNQYKEISGLKRQLQCSHKELAEMKRQLALSKLALSKLEKEEPEPKKSKKRARFDDDVVEVMTIDQIDKIAQAWRAQILLKRSSQ